MQKAQNILGQFRVEEESISYLEVEAARFAGTLPKTMPIFWADNTNKLGRSRGDRLIVNQKMSKTST